MPSTFQCSVSLRRLALSLICAALAALPSLPGLGQQLIDIDDHRPLYEAVMILEQMAGYPIHYEDPPYAHEDDLQDVSSEAQRASVPGYRLLVPKRGRLEYVPPADAGSLDLTGLAKTVHGLVTAYRSEQGDAEVFDSFREGDSVYIVPVRIRDKHGSIVPVRPLMETRIPTFSSSPPEARLADVLSQCTALISQASGVRVVPGAVPIGPPGSFPFSFEGGTVRDLFVQINKKLSGFALSYQLLYDPTQGYMLNTRWIRKRNP